MSPKSKNCIALHESIIIADIATKWTLNIPTHLKCFATVYLVLVIGIWFLVFHKVVWRRICGVVGNSVITVLPTVPVKEPRKSCFYATLCIPVLYMWAKTDFILVCMKYTDHQLMFIILPFADLHIYIHSCYIYTWWDNKLKQTTIESVSEQLRRQYTPCAINMATLLFLR